MHHPLAAQLRLHWPQGIRALAVAIQPSHRNFVVQVTKGVLPSDEERNLGPGFTLRDPRSPPKPVWRCFAPCRAVAQQPQRVRAALVPGASAPITILSVLCGEGRQEVQLATESRSGPPSSPLLTLPSSDHIATFNGNTDDDFIMGVTLTRMSLRLYTEPHEADLVVTPLALHTRITQGAPDGEGPPGAEVILMQNCAYLTEVFETLNQIPVDPRHTDFARALRQSAAPPRTAPSRPLTRPLEYPGTVGQARTGAPQVFQRVPVSGLGAADQERFDYFLGHLWPALPGMDPAAARAAAAAEATPTSHHRLPTKGPPVRQSSPTPSSTISLIRVRDAWWRARSRMYGMEWGARGEREGVIWISLPSLGQTT
ncbi:hypothetical protein PAPYR_11786 [Paratrimastix pyriformis]|uniref:UTP25 NTP hydrolase-like domain-containing protein n=1 Tax=Paratrimastix pyriformis TaxID=342808 RepID=A0ABQ8U8K4_9EUKA|nr:hypothetical protein PAPYR_11786 [Paratrimastix pyriformis]